MTMELRQREMPLICGHRGSCGSAPENTLASFRRAVDDGADMVELDVRLTKDAELVVLHDRSVNRTTNGRGTLRRLTLDQIQSLDAGSWFSKKFAGEPLPTLRQVVEILPSHISLNIEVKTDGERRRMEEPLLHLLRTMDLVDRVLVSSFDHQFLQRFHARDPEILIGALLSPIRDMGKKPSAIARRTGAAVFLCSIRQITKRLADDVHAHDLVLGCYGVNSRKQCGKAMKFHAGIIISDYPKRVKSYLPHSRG
jgi:glycerophosphoryl diester phosphodiesterase